MKKRIIGLIVLLLCLAIPAFAASKEDFSCKGIRIGDDAIKVFEKFGDHTVDIEKLIGDRIVVYYIYQDFRVGIDKMTNQVADVRLKDKEYSTEHGVKIGATSHKILKEYGKNKKEKLHDGIYYVYREGTQKLMFNMSQGYLTEIRLTDLPE